MNKLLKKAKSLFLAVLLSVSSLVTAAPSAITTVNAASGSLDIDTAFKQLVGDDTSNGWHYSWYGYSLGWLLGIDSEDLYDYGADCTRGTIAVEARALSNAGYSAWDYLGNLDGHIGEYPDDLFSNLDSSSLWTKVYSSNPGVGNLQVGDIIVYGESHSDIYAGNGKTVDFGSNGRGNGTYYGLAMHMTYDGSGGSGSSSSGVTAVYRPKLNKTLTVNVVKSSTNTAITSADSSYSLSGAVYSVYSNSSCTNRIGTITTGSDGKGSTSITVSSGTNYLYVKETTASKNYELDGTVYTLNYSSSNSATANSSETPKTKSIEVDLTKSSSIPSITDGNSCYDLSGAVYDVYDGSTKLGSITTDSEGNGSWSGNGFRLGLNTLTVTEVKAPTGYELDDTPITVSINGSTNTGTVEVSDVPGNDPLTIQLTKESEDPVENPASLAGAQFTVKYYDAQYSTVEEAAAGTPTRTWVIQTIKSTNGDRVKYVASLTDDCKISGDDFYTTNVGKAVLPIGTVTVEETKAPEGYELDNKVLYEYDGTTAEWEETDGIALFNITSNDSGIAAVKGGNYYTVSETVTRGGLKIQKNDSETLENAAQGDGSDLTTVFEVVNKNTYDVMAKDKDGNVLGTASTDGVICSVSTDANGFFASGENFLPEGDYVIREATAPAGYLIEGTTEAEFSIAANGEIVDLTANIYDDVIRGGFRFRKNDADQGAEAQGDADLSAVFDLINVSENAVIVDGARYEVGETITSFTTDASGYYETDTDLLPYGTYKVVETSQPTGYAELNGEVSATFEVRNDGELVDLTTEISDNIIRGTFNFNKTDAETTDAQGNANLSGTFDVINRSSHAVTVNGTKYGVGEVCYEFTTDAYGIFTAPDRLLPYGSYEVVEVEAPEGYLSSSGTASFTIREEDEVADVTGVIKNEVIRGGFELQKNDSETGTTAQGDTNLQITFEVVNDSDHAVLVDDVLYASGEVVLTETTDEAGYYKSAEDLLPYGDYIVNETVCPTGYTSKGTTTASFTISENKQIADLTSVIENEVQTGDFQIHKVRSKYVDTDEEETYDEANAEFTAVLKKYVDKYGSVAEAMKHTDEMTDREYDVITTDVNGIAKSKKLAYGTYVIAQTKTGDGELKLLKDTIEFNVFEENQGTTYYEATNETKEYQIYIVKKDAVTGETVTLDSAEFKIKDLETGKYVSQRVGLKKYSTFKTVSANGASEEAGSGVFYPAADEAEAGAAITPLTIPAGEYEIEEVSAPDGFTVLSEPIKITVKESSINKVTEEGYPYVEVDASNDRITGTLEVSKSIEDFTADTSFIDRTDLSGIVFTLTAAEDIINPDDGSVYVRAGEVAKDINGNVVGTFNVSRTGKAKVTDLPLGKYSLTETKVPNGMVLNTEAKEVVFAQAEDDSVTAVYTVTKDIENRTTKVSVSKKAGTGDDELPGAALTLKDAHGETVDEWISGTKQHVIEGLVAGAPYTLTETITPNGYATAKTITFTVNSDGTVQTVTMIDKKVTVSKQDEGGKEVEGAKITVTDESGKIIDSWTSGKTSHVINGVEAGKTYTLHEEFAPNGYYYAENQTFTVSDNEDQLITMVDNVIHYAIVKVDDIDGSYVEGVTLKLTDITDAENPVEVELPNKGVTTSEPFQLDGVLIAEHVYNLEESEIVAGVYKATDIQFTVPKYGTADVTTITMQDATTAVSVSKIDNHGNAVPGAAMQIYEAKEDEQGNVTKGDLVMEFTSEDKPTDVSKVLKGGSKYILSESEAPFGFNKIEDMVFTVTGTQDQHQILVATDVRKNYYISAVKVDAQDTAKRLKGAELTLYTADGKVAKDINGKDCVAVTDGNGVITWNVEYNADNFKDSAAGYYVVETKAPAGYRINSDKHYAVLSETYDFAVNNPVTVVVNDSMMPSTGVTAPVAAAAAGMIALIGLAVIFYRRRHAA